MTSTIATVHTVRILDLLKDQSHHLPLAVQWGRGVKTLVRIDYSARHGLAYLHFEDGSEYSAPPAAGLKLPD